MEKPRLQLFIIKDAKYRLAKCFGPHQLILVSSPSLEPRTPFLMKVVYDPDQDILQIALVTTVIEETAQIAPGLILDYDEDGHVIGLEIRRSSIKTDSPYAISFNIGKANINKPLPNVKE